MNETTVVDTVVASNDLASKASSKRPGSCCSPLASRPNPAFSPIFVIGGVGGVGAAGD